MAVTSNTALRITELDFDGIKNNLKAYLRSQSEFQDYDFEGSGMSVLLDILAYNTHYMGYYLNMVGNEMFMDTAQLRSSILSHAKNINYLPGSRRGAKALVNILITPSNSEDNVSTSVTLSKYSKFLGTDIDGVNYSFVAINSNTAIKNSGTFSFSNVTIQQGEVVSQQYIMDSSNTKRRFKIPSANVDTDTIEVRVQESSSNSDVTVFKKSNNITGLSSNSTVYFVEENDDYNYNIYFGDGVISAAPKNGNIITISYLDTVGTPANSISKFSSTGVVGGLFRDNVIVTSVTASYGGTDKETIEQIRLRAPYAYNTQDRGVTPGDYETLLLKQYPNIQAVSVWGGEDNDPVVYGKVFIAIRTKQNYVLTNLEKEYIKKDLIKTKNVMTVTTEIVDPEYVYVRIVGKVTYNPALTTLSDMQLKEVVKAAIQDYNTYELTGFSSTFRKSKLQYYIEAADKSITGSDITVYVQKRVILNTTSSKKYNIYYNMPLKKGNYIDRVYSFPEILVNDNEGVERNAIFEEVLTSQTGINSFTITSGGSGYLTEPTVTVTGDGSGCKATAVISGGRVIGIKIISKGSDYTRAVVTISGGSGSGAEATALLENNYGTLRTFYYKSDGEKVVINPTAGTIDYLNGSLVLNSLVTAGAVPNDFYADDEFTFYAPVSSEIISPIRNRILVIDEADAKTIQIDMIAEA